jgi:D-sedoheptulose 7-phosphate isomerase
MDHYFSEICGLLEKIEVTSREGKTLRIAAAVETIAGKLKAMRGTSHKAFLIGNGASAAIAGHMSADFLKNGRIPAISFSDPALLTCVSNDLGYESVFSVPIGTHARESDMLIAISSSGRSPNILQAVSVGREKGCFIVSLSGFDTDNLLRNQGEINFYVPSRRYGAVEVAHHAICHRIADAL